MGSYGCCKSYFDKRHRVAAADIDITDACLESPILDEEAKSLYYV